MRVTIYRGSEAAPFQSLRLITPDLLFVFATFLVLAVPALISYAADPRIELYQYIISIFLSIIGILLSHIIIRPKIHLIYHHDFHTFIAPKMSFIVKIMLLIMISSIIFIFLTSRVQLVDALTGVKYGTESRFAQENIPLFVLVLFEISRRFLIIFVVVYFILQKNVYKTSRDIVNKSFGFLSNFLIFMCGLIYCALTLDRSPPFAYVLVIILVTYYLNKRKKISTRILNKIFILLLFFLSLIIMAQISAKQYYNQTVDINKIYTLVIYILNYRIFGSPMDMALRVYSEFNYSNGFLNFETIRMLNILIGRGYISSLDTTISPNSITPSTFVADLWRQGGYVVVFCFSFLFGCILNIMTARIRLVHTDALVFYVLFVFSPMLMVHGKFFGGLAWGLIIISFYFSHYSSKKFRKYLKEKMTDSNDNCESIPLK